MAKIYVSKFTDNALPEYSTPYSSGVDLRADIKEEGGYTILEPGDRELIRTGLYMAIPEGMEGQIRPRSGLALKYGVTVLNAPGTIDSDYRGEIKVILINHGKGPVTIHHGDRIAQLVFAKVERIEGFVERDFLPETSRGEGGFGHTGTK